MKVHKKVEMPPKPEWWTDQIPKNQIVKIDWHNQNNYWWNETCADVLEVFGLPGGRFYYKPHPDHMTFTFKTKKDADLAKVLLSEKISESFTKT